MAKQPAKISKPNVYCKIDNTTVVMLEADVVKAYMEIAEVLAEGSKQENQLVNLHHVSDERLYKVISSVPGNGRDPKVQQARAEKLLEMPIIEVTENEEPLPADVRSVLPGTNFGLELAEDSEFDKHLEAGVTGREIHAGTPLLAAEDLMKKFGGKKDNQGKEISPNRMRHWPIPGSGTGQWKKDHHGYNGPMDKESKKASNGDTVRWSFYENIVDAQPEVGKYKVVSDMIKALGKNEKIEGKVPEEFEDIVKDESTAVAELKKWRTNKRGQAVRMVGLAVKYLQKKWEIEEQLPFVGVSLVYPGNIVRSSSLSLPIVLVSRDNADPDHRPRSKPQSLSTFIRMDVKEAKTKGGKVVDLLATVKRDPKKPASAAIIPVPKLDDITTPKLPDYVSAMNNYFTKESSLSVLSSELAKGNDESVDLLTNLDILYRNLWSVIEPYSEVLAEMKRADTAQSAARMKAKQQERQSNVA